ncbi:hypothetical protein AWH56_008505 [Anaerobacillus isosaccharinicus]|uniref:Uncharacterized protein n=1 Tax=Anaerobacillus isosaccharinicus TaxID=1532552 RepID=A0A7S7LAV4_9BACI|nr:hypothetical protein [Anaerobacillus isosaccharinicus]MBA5583975.1 hypothetical protein [Anaerobacillus isosaccharinicus]QOY37607.1 hypothetical protein AWH56_008505 [Anaerobacillus isosaccharinicus]
MEDTKIMDDFWAESDEVGLPFKRKEYLQLSFSENEYERMIDLVEKQKERLFQDYFNALEIRNNLVSKLGGVVSSRVGKEDDPVKSDVKVEMYNEKIMVIRFNHLLPFYSSEKSKVGYSQILKKHYSPTISNAIVSENPNFKLKKAFVAIVQYFPRNMIRDLDNQFKRFIFNALRSSLVVKDDSFHYLQYMDIGLVDNSIGNETGRTEVYVTEWENMDQVLRILPNK